MGLEAKLFEKEGQHTLHSLRFITVIDTSSSDALASVFGIKKIRFNSPDPLPDKNNHRQVKFLAGPERVSSLIY